MLNLDLVKSALLGIAVGDALGVPYEFTSRSIMDEHPAVGMTGFGTHDQPIGIFSDDSSLTFCLAETIIEGYSIHRLASAFIKWYDEAYWSAHNEVFDIGITTQNAIGRLKNGCLPNEAADNDEFSNGNGSLMRILPLVFLFDKIEFIKRFELIHEVSSLTHGHIRSTIACSYYLEYAFHLMNGIDKVEAYTLLQASFSNQLEAIGIEPSEITVFHRLLDEAIANAPRDTIQSSGYVIHTLEASIWCLLTSDSYSEAVLKAVNLGGDTDTTAAVTGGLAALYYGVESIPSLWLEQLCRKDAIEELAYRLCRALS
jgi:ADP-ribosylglycohydrolase